MITVSGPGKTLCFLPGETTAGQGRHSFLLLDKRDVDAAPGWNSTAMFSPLLHPHMNPNTHPTNSRQEENDRHKEGPKGLSILILRCGGSEKETTLHLR